MDADEESTPVISGGIYNRAYLFPPITCLGQSRFRSLAPFIPLQHQLNSLSSGSSSKLAICASLTGRATDNLQVIAVSAIKDGRFAGRNPARHFIHRFAHRLLGIKSDLSGIFLTALYARIRQLIVDGRAPKRETNFDRLHALGAHRFIERLKQGSLLGTANL